MFQLNHSSPSLEEHPVLISVMGTTASGKTDLAEALADELGAQLINADAFQVYQGMDIGTAKSTRKSEYELIDFLTPDQSTSVGDYVNRIIPVLKQLYQIRRSAVIVGGTGLYIRAVMESYNSMCEAPNPELRQQLNEVFESRGVQGLQERLVGIEHNLNRDDYQNPRRLIRAIEKSQVGSCLPPPEIPSFRKLKCEILFGNEQLKARIQTRFDQMIDAGWMDEVKNLLNNGYKSSDPGFRAHGYRWMSQVISGQLPQSDARERTIQEIVRYSKRQRTWLRREPNLVHLEPGELSDLVNQIKQSFVFG